MTFCRKCGKQLEDDANFCQACGQGVNSSLPPQPTAYNKKPAPPEPGKDLSLMALILGAVSFTYGVIPAIVGLVLGVKGYKQNKEAGAPTTMATAGIILCIASISLTVMVFVISALIIIPMIFVIINEVSKEIQHLIFSLI